MKDEININDLQSSNSDQVLHLRTEIKSLRGQIQNLRKQIGEKEEFSQLVCASVAACEPFSKRIYVSPKRKEKSVIPVIKLSDFHIGEVVQAKETEGFNAFNWEIAQARIFSIIDGFLKWVDIQRTAYQIDECAIFCEGDLVSGDIHYELQVTNEFPLPEQTAKAGLLLGEIFKIVSPRFKKVTVYMVGADNHGRLQKKPQAKQKTTNNMSFLVHALARAYVEKCKNIHFIESNGIKLLANINGLKILSEHGDTVKGWSGLPFYGFQRIVGKESRRRMNTEKGFHVWSIGHFHVPSFIEDTILVNGSLSGTSEFDHSQGRYAKPCQLAYMIHPKHGLFNIVPFYGV